MLPWANRRSQGSPSAAVPPGWIDNRLWAQAAAMTGLSHWGRLMNWKGPVLPVVGGVGHAECGGASHGVLIGEDGALLPSGGPVGHPVWSLGLLGSRRHDVGVDPRALAHRRIERDSEQSSTPL